MDGGWSDWVSVGTCSATCGNGTQLRKRTCTNPEPANGGNNCEETEDGESKEQPCFVEACPGVVMCQINQLECYVYK